MFRMLRYDFYKLFKSYVFWIFFAFTFLAILINPMVNWILYASDYSYMIDFMGFCNFQILYKALVIIFPVFIVGRDFSGGYMKNIYPAVNKVYYVISKVFLTFLYCLIIVLLDISLNCFLSLFFKGTRKFVDIAEWNAQGFFTWAFANIFALWAISCISMQIYTICKYNVVSMIIMLLWFYVLEGYSIYPLFNVIGDALSKKKIILSNYLPTFIFELQLIETHFLTDIKAIRAIFCTCTFYVVVPSVVCYVTMLFKKP